MLVTPLQAELTGFGLAAGWKSGIVKNLSYRGPEVLLKLPSLDEAVDMWTWLRSCILGPWSTLVSNKK